MGVAAALFPQWLLWISEQVYRRRRIVSGPGWTLAAIGITSAAWLRQLNKLRYPGHSDHESCIWLAVLLMFLVGFWLWQVFECMGLPGLRTTRGGSARFKRKAYQMNALGLVNFSGVVLFMLLEGHRLWVQ